MNKRIIFCSIALSIFNFLSSAMDLPLDYGIQEARLPRELLIATGAPNDGARDVFTKTCKYLHQTFSLNGAQLINLINHPLFNTSKQNIQWLAFNAAYAANVDLLKSVMRHMVQSDYVYQCDSGYSHKMKFGLQSISACKMPKYSTHLVEEAKKYHCDFNCDPNYDICPDNDLFMAFYNKNENKVAEILNRDGVQDWRKMLFVGIDKNSGECINKLFSYIKKNRYTSDGLEILDDCLEYESFLKVAMNKDKDKAFEAIASNDIFGCLNYVRTTDDTVLDCLMCYIEIQKLANGQKYINIYRKHGGKTFGELKQEFRLPPCVIQ